MNHKPKWPCVIPRIMGGWWRSAATPQAPDNWGTAALCPSHPPQRRVTTSAVVLTAVLLLDGASAAWAQSEDKRPPGLREVGVTENLDAQVPGDLQFVDSLGNKVTLSQYFDGQRPVLLTMNYSSCPKLCSLQLNGLFDALKKMKWDMGGKFQMVTVSIDPLETPQRAAMTKQKYLKIYRRAGATGGYNFLTGRDDNIKRLAEVVGYRYKYSPVTRQYAHAAVTMVLTPDGRVSRYLYGVQYDPQTLRLSLLEAAQGKIGSTMDQILLFCFDYDSEQGRYALAALRLMQIGGGLTVVLLGGAIWVFRRREKSKAAAGQTEETG